MSESNCILLFVTGNRLLVLEFDTGTLNLYFYRSTLAPEILFPPPALSSFFLNCYCPLAQIQLAGAKRVKPQFSVQLEVTDSADIRHCKMLTLHIYRSARYRKRVVIWSLFPFNSPTTDYSLDFIQLLVLVNARDKQ